MDYARLKIAFICKYLHSDKVLWNLIRCEPEYFGFPDCQPCSCPSTAKCDEVTGECICAPFVTGTAVWFNPFLYFLGIVQNDPQDAPCTMCEENTYGYNAVTGCQECSCRTEGTNGDMSCRYVSDVLKSTSIDIPAKGALQILLCGFCP